MGRSEHSQKKKAALNKTWLEEEPSAKNATSNSRLQVAPSNEAIQSTTIISIPLDTIQSSAPENSTCACGNKLEPGETCEECGVFDRSYSASRDTQRKEDLKQK